MPRQKKSDPAAPSAGDAIASIKYPAKRKNLPPAGLEAQGRLQETPRLRYEYNPHLPPALRSAPEAAAADRLPELLATARQRALSAEEASILADALRRHEPWLEWSGKREKPWFEVEPVALHMHERVSAQAILRVLAREEVERDLFADPQHDYAQAVQFYQHDVDWANRMILGDSLQVMASLARREDLAGKVQMIYLDPPYGIKFASNFQPQLGQRDVKDRVQDLTREPEMVKAYRDTWTLGIHSYLAYLRDRLAMARELLADSGSIFVQISDENLHRVRCVMDEVFGTECHIITIPVKKKGAQKSGMIDPVNDYLLWYARSPRESGKVRFKSVFVERELDEETLNEFRIVEFPDGRRYPVSAVPTDGKDVDYREKPERLFKDHPEARIFRPWPITNGGFRATQMDPIDFEGRQIVPPDGRCWSFRSQLQGKERPPMLRLRDASRLCAFSKALDGKRYLNDFSFKVMTNWWDALGGAPDPIYVVQTNPTIIERCLLMTTDPGDLVLDPTCGSGTTAFVAEQWGRRWITCDSSRVALALAKHRLMTAKFDYFALRALSAEDVARNPHGTWLVEATSPSLSSKASGADAASTVAMPTWFDPRQPIGHVRGGNLPHWRQDGATYFVTWRTADSMPKERVEQWLREREEWLARHPQPHSERDQAEYDQLFSARWEQWLDECHGECLLRQPGLKAVVEGALRHGDGRKYRLDEFVVMPNHVHVLVTPTGEHLLSDIVQGWKSFTAHEINRLTGRKGTFWQKESFDHIVRGAEQLERIRRYIRENPVEATSASLSFEASGGDAASTTTTRGRYTFKCKTVPHITLKSIARNTSLDPIFAKHEPILAAKLAALNQQVAKVKQETKEKLVEKLIAKHREHGANAVTDADTRRWLLPGTEPGLLKTFPARAPLKGITVKQAEGYRAAIPGSAAFQAASKTSRQDAGAPGWQEWEVPFDTDAGWPQPLQDALTDYRKAWRAKMDEVNACIAANAEMEELVDKPEIVKGVVRVSGPFSIEGVIAVEEGPDTPIGGAPGELDTFDGEAEVQNAEAHLDKIIRLLKASGVDFPGNKNMKFSRLDPLTSAELIHAEGEWDVEATSSSLNSPISGGDAASTNRRVAVSIGPEIGNVTAMQVEDVVRDANRKGYDDVVFAGFGFDAAAQDAIESASHPKVRMHMALIRPDVAMGDLLKTQPGSQLFTVFSAPRVQGPTKQKDGEYRVEVEGMDVYDPVSNTLFPTDKERIAAWFLDTDYDGRTFCICQAFFPDKSKWAKLAKALGDARVIEADAFDALSGLTSLPFPRPERLGKGETWRVAVKVIDPRGNEGLRVLTVKE